MPWAAKQTGTGPCLPATHATPPFSLVCSATTPHTDWQTDPRQLGEPHPTRMAETWVFSSESKAFQAWLKGVPCGVGGVESC